MKRPIYKKEEVKMAGIGARTNQAKAKKATVMSKHTIPKTASSGIKHQVILPKSSTVIASASSSPRQVKTNGTFSMKPVAVTQQSTITVKAASRPGRVSKRNGVWYLGGNHVVKLLTSVDGDLDHSVLAKLAAVPTVVGELALSVESLVSDDITVGGFEKDLLAKITSNTLTAKRGIRSAATPPPTPPASTGVAQNNHNGQPTPHTAAAAGDTNTALPAQVGEGQVPNPLLANYQPVPNPLAIRITPPASPHTAVTDQEKPANGPKTRAELPMIQAR